MAPVSALRNGSRLADGKHDADTRLAANPQGA